MKTLAKGLVLSLALALCAGSALADTIKIGVAGAHSGDLASYGLPSLNAAKLVVKDFNAKGGILGKQIEIVAQDDMCKPEMATNAATKLVSEKVAVVLGHICSGATKAALPIYKEAKIVVMSPSATNPPLTQSGEYPNFFRTIAPDDEQAKLGVRFVTEKLGKKKIAVIHDKGDYGKGYAEFAEMFVKEGGKAQVVLFEGVTQGAVDYSAVVQKIKQSGADAVMFGGYHPEASKIVAQMRKKGMTIPFISDDGVKADTFIQVAGKDAEGVYASSPWDISKNPMNVKAEKDYVAEFQKEPGQFYAQAYSAMLTLINAIQKAGGADYDKIEKALRTDFVETPVGKIKFDKKGDAEGVGFSMFQVKGGKYVEVDFK
jgi:branched-chain amino acid transport system substrate-binding protein